MTARLDLEYDGTGFTGWARQPGMRTVQGELETALETVLRRRVELTVAGRTDRGVHARGQVASHAGEPAPVRNLNALLPDDVAVLRSEPAVEGFDARRDARSRVYRYRVLARPEPSAFERGRALWWSRPLERERLDACAALLPGTHDFTAFTPTETDHVRFSRDVIERPLGRGGRRRDRVPDRGRHIHAAHGPRAGGNDARRRQPGAFRATSRRQAAQRGGGDCAATRPLPGASEVLSILERRFT